MTKTVYGCVCMLLTAAQLCSQTAMGTEFTFQQKLESIAKNKRSTNAYNSIYSRTPAQVAESVYNSLYRQIIHDEHSVDIVIVLDGSAGMGRDSFVIAQKFLARLVSMMPAEKFRDGSIKIAMITYSLSESLLKQFNFTWSGGAYREMVRRAIKKASYQNGYENHGTAALIWADSMLAESPRYNNSETAKVILFATNGHLTDKDLYEDVDDATLFVTNWMKEQGYKLFTIVPGTVVDRTTISKLSSVPHHDYVIPVVNSHAVSTIADNIKDHKRGAHNHRSP